MIEWKLFEVKQRKYKLVLGWVTIWWVILLIRRRVVAGLGEEDSPEPLDDYKAQLSHLVHR